jgi:cysteine desulfurase family protein (TIGR01976 family)
VIPSLDVEHLRTLFPALQRTVAGRPVAHLDGPGGTQVPQTVIDAMSECLSRGVSNLGGVFVASAEADELVEGARSAVADLVGGDRSEIVFGQNMTSLTFSASRAIAREWKPGDEVVVTSLDHDANVSPWRLAAEDRGAQVRVADIDPEDGTLDLESLDGAIGERTRLVAVTAASNALGTVTPLTDIVEMAHRVGALVFVDAVHYSAHRISDVRALGADFLAASAYKFFGPHTGLLWGKAEHLDRLTPYKVVPAPGSGPGKWETGTQAFESLAGVGGAVDYLAALGNGATRRERLESAFEAIRAHEDSLAERFLASIAEMPGVTVYGVADGARLDERAPTFAVDVAGVTAREAAAEMGRRGIFVWDGHYYAVAVMQRLDLAARGGLVRIGFVHYNTPEEVDRVLAALDDISRP